MSQAASTSAPIGGGNANGSSWPIAFIVIGLAALIALFVFRGKIK